MSTRFYQAPGLNIDRMVRDFENIFQAQGYQVQHFGNQGHMVVQLRKGGDLEAILGMQAALTVIFRGAPGGVVALVGEHHWENKAASGLVGMIFFWPLLFTTGAGVLRQAGLETQLFEALDAVALQQRSDVQMGPVPPHLEAQMQQQGPGPMPGGPPPTSTYTPPRQGSSSAGQQGQKPCAHCQKLNDADDLYCSWCGKSLKPQTAYCPRCKAAMKSGAPFCSKCGAASAQ
ncbi:hypothetical protein KDW_51260 [Dictyobacter vulcani]|uniref:DZANK-type domain-containing protein n=1 Tax=Dictyobacter vulcani TaxID=2607529 RepID=A0A5J4KNN5_9CHLR|nr:zinc ribbon domain-containing protein [Dictyobacter vulcani]GER90964.1 hypothetical protein KDW_51260 [Dictyobacter vulcani]